MRDGSTRLSARREADPVDLFGLQDAVAEAIGTALGLTSHENRQAVEPPTRNTAAYELFLRAAERLSKFNRWDMRTAIDMLEDSTRLDPDFADAWARLGEACANMHLAFEPTGRWLPTAQRGHPPCALAQRRQCPGATLPGRARCGTRRQNSRFGPHSA